ncbi:MAG TPA: NAD(P)/FAD-dependent oxidoreductase [Gemmatimonadaceae bacterium]|nr:NAD(P)/FAD-dependent oxidoreductase [Gemmatimonadaceae bacterium]
MHEDKSYDVAIVGGGPAGLTAALWLGRYLHRVVVIDSGDPRNWETRGVNGFPGHPGITPAELRGRTRDQCREYDVELIDGFVARARRDRDAFVVDYDQMPTTKAREDQRGSGAPRTPSDNAPRPETRSLRAARLLLAFGLRDEWPKVPGLRQVYGSAAHVCPDCDGYDTVGKKVVVIASGRKAAGMALNLTTWTTDIVVCTNGREPDLDADQCAKLDALNIPVISARIDRVVPQGDRIYSLELDGGVHLDCDHIFFALSQRPADDLGAQLDCKRDDDGQIIVSEHQQTSERNVWAAGDVTRGAQLAIVAAAEGAVAALSIHKSLVPNERRLRSRKRPSDRLQNESARESLSRSR